MNYRLSNQRSFFKVGDPVSLNPDSFLGQRNKIRHNEFKGVVTKVQNRWDRPDIRVEWDNPPRKVNSWVDPGDLINWSPRVIEAHILAYKESILRSLEKIQELETLLEKEQALR